MTAPLFLALPGMFGRVGLKGRKRCTEPLLTGHIIDVVGRSYDVYEAYAASDSDSSGAAFA